MFYSKIILFGEYSMIFDSVALMIPFRKFKAYWSFGNTLTDEREKSSNAAIRRFADYLSGQTDFGDKLDLKRLADDLDKGLFLYSDVPSSYGLGSSGVLVAAVYKRYGRQTTDDTMALKRLFGQMESYFHGSSSGIDPLQCYLGKPFQIKDGKLELLDEGFLNKEIRVCLIDTGRRSKTGPLVNYFKEKRMDEDFLIRFQKEYVPHVTSCIETMLKGDVKDFFDSLGCLSAAQMTFLLPMITDNTLPLFEMRPDFHFGVKISGSGGGGYMLGFTDDVDSASKLLESYNVIWI